mmetsp:Transcript_56276/g.103284  ORF Transcript_56276/g.103284 Transcript_56276/m.103284 type:complete len:256 (+) Transcript_56276:78-845(+)
MESGTECGLSFEVRLPSGEEVAQLCLQPNDTVSSIFAHLPVADSSPVAETLLLGDCLLDPRARICDTGLTHGAVVTLVLSPLLWSLDHKGSQAEIGADCRTAWRVDGESQQFAIVVSRAPMRTFRLRIVRTCDCRFGGLEVGFTATAPESLPTELPSNLDKLPESWVSNSVGSLIANHKWILGKSWDESAAPELLEVDDVITCVAGGGGQLCIIKNDRTVATWDADMPEGVALYPIANIVGRVKCIELLFGNARE